MPCEAFESVVRIDGLGFQSDNIFLDIGGPVAIFIADSQNAITFRQIHPATWSKFQVHRGIGRIVKQLPLLNTAVVVGIAEDQDFVMLRPNIVFGAEMRVRGDNPDPSLRIYVNTGGRRQPWMFAKASTPHLAEESLARVLVLRLRWKLQRSSTSDQKCTANA